jgi:hypothetical protein
MFVCIFICRTVRSAFFVNSEMCVSERARREREREEARKKGIERGEKVVRQPFSRCVPVCVTFKQQAKIVYIAKKESRKIQLQHTRTLGPLPKIFRASTVWRRGEEKNLSLSLSLSVLYTHIIVIIIIDVMYSENELFSSSSAAAAAASLYTRFTHV